MRDAPNFVIETGVDIYEKSPRNRNGKWKDIASRMSCPRPDPITGKIIYDSVSHTEDGKSLTAKEATALCNALRGQGSNSAMRKNGNGGFRVWRAT